MATITKPYTFANNTVADPAQVNSNFDTIYTEFNGAIGSANVDSSIVTLTGTQSLSNKTLTKPTVNASVQAITADSDGTTITFDMTSSNVHTVTLGGNRTLAVSNVTAGQFFYIRLLQDGTGSRTVTWFSTIKWADATAPTLTTTAARADLFAFFCTSSGNYDGFVVGQNIG